LPTRRCPVMPPGLQLLRRALDTGTAPLLITSALASGLRDVARVRVAAGLSAGEIAKRLQLPDWKVERTLRRGRSWADAGVAAALRAVAAADLDVKGAGADDAYILERLVLAVTAACVSPAAAGLSLSGRRIDFVAGHRVGRPSEPSKACSMIVSPSSRRRAGMTSGGRKRRTLPNVRR